jgi:Uma2 family endonuclease
MSLAMLEGRAFEPLTRAYRRMPNAPGEPPAEDRVVLGGVSWEQYLVIDEERGADNSQPRLYFLEDQIEIMTTSLRHERLKKRIADLVLEFFNERDVEMFPNGQATMQQMGHAGAEPDESWCIGAEKDHPDIVLEIALTSGGLNKIEIYRRFAIPEVWFWRRDRLEIWHLREDGSGYEGPERASRALPDFEVALLERCIALPTWREARRAFREGLARG